MLRFQLSAGTPTHKPATFLWDVLNSKSCGACVLRLPKWGMSHEHEDMVSIGWTLGHVALSIVDVVTCMPCWEWCACPNTQPLATLERYCEEKKSLSAVWAMTPPPASNCSQQRAQLISRRLRKPGHVARLRHDAFTEPLLLGTHPRSHLNSCTSCATTSKRYSFND